MVVANNFAEVALQRVLLDKGLDDLTLSWVRAATCCFDDKPHDLVVHQDLVHAGARWRTRA